MDKEKLLQEARNNFYFEFGSPPENDGYMSGYVYDMSTVVFATGEAELDAFCRCRKNTHRVNKISLLVIALLPVYMLVSIWFAIDLDTIVNIGWGALAVVSICLLLQIINAYRNRKLKKIYRNNVIVYFSPHHRSGFCKE